MLLENQSHMFEMEDGVTYLNAASYTPLPRATYEAGLKGLARKYRPWAMNGAEPPAEAELIRSLFGNLVGAPASDIAIVSSTSYGVAVMAKNLPISTGQEIVVITDQFPSNIFSWRHLAKETGASLKVAPRPEDGNWTPNVLDVIGPNTAITALPPCHWADGTRLDLEAIGEKCREVGAALCIDSTQTAGAMPMDMSRIQPDFMVASAYKWLLCPYTLAFLYVAPHRQNGTPLEQHRWNMANIQAEATEVEYPEEFAKGAGRFDMGERNNFINMPMAVASLEQLAAWTPAAIQETLRGLTDMAADLARGRGWGVVPDENRVGHFLGVRPSSSPPVNIGAQMKAKGFHISLRGGNSIRIAPYLFNDASDIQRTFEALDDLLD